MNKQSTNQIIPPHNAELEIAVLSSITHDPTIFDEILDTLGSVESFHLTTHRVLFGAIESLHQLNHPITVTSISQWLKDKDFGIDNDKLIDLTAWHIAPATALHYAKKLRKLSVARQLAIIGETIQADALNLRTDPDDIRLDAEQKIFNLGEFGNTSKVESSQHVFFSVLDQFESYQTNNSPSVRTHFIDLDNLTGGFQESEFITVAGRPGMGKSKLISQSLMHAAIEDKIPSLLFNLEMTNKNVGERLACCLAGVNYFSIRTNTASADNIKAACNAAIELAKLPIRWVDHPRLKPSELLSTIRKEKRRYGIRVAVVDHFLLMQSNQRHKSAYERVSEVTRMLKLIAKETKVPIVGVCQMNRAIEQRSDETPRLSDLRDSGSIEQDSDQVWFLHQSAKDKAENVTQIFVAKQRNGPTGSIRLYDSPGNFRFHNYAGQSR